MFSASVLQKATLPVSARAKKPQNWPSFGPPARNYDGRDSISPKPSART